MVDLELTRSPADRDLYVLEGIGTLRLEGLGSVRATAEAGANRWSIARRGFWRRLQATDALGTVVGTFERRPMGGSVLRWHDRRFTLRRASVWRERYALADTEGEFALFDAKGWGRRPVRVTVDHPAALDPGLLLFAAFVTRALAVESSAATTTAATAGVS